MAGQSSTPSARQSELLELAYAYACRHGLSDLSLRPLAAAIGSSPRVLMFLFGTKEGLVRALLARARSDELALLDRIQLGDNHPGLEVVAEQVWVWLSADDHRALLRLWVEGYARSLVDPHGAWAGFAHATVTDWLGVLAAAQPPAERDTPTGAARRSAALAVLRGALLDLLATGDLERTTAAVDHQLQTLRHPAPGCLSDGLGSDRHPAGESFTGHHRLVPLAVRPAEASDADFLAEMLVAAALWRPDGPSGSVTEVLGQPQLAHYVAGWPRPGDLGVIALDGQQPVGAAWVRLFPESDPGYGFVEAATPELSMGVVQAWRGRGVGSCLLDALIVAAHAQGLASLSLSVEPDNNARRLYERVGFRQVDEVSGSLTMLLRL